MFNNALYFQADDGTAGFELHRLDSSGTVTRVADIQPGGGDSSPFGFTEFDGALYFSASTSAFGTELYRLDSDGNVELVADINPGANSSGPGFFNVFNGSLYFRALTSDDGRELYRLDSGEDAEPVQVVDLNNGSGNSNPFGFTIFPADTGPAPNLALSVADAGVAEGDDGDVSTFEFTVTRSDNTAGTTTVDWEVTGSGSNPASGADFVGGQLPAGTVGFADGETSQTVTIQVAGDNSVEPDEGFTLTLSNPSGGATISTGDVSATIEDDDGVVVMPPIEEATDAFRFFNTVAQGHFFTTDPAERDFVLNTLPQFTPEGVGFEALPADTEAEGATDVFRFFNTVAQGHFFTTDPAERDFVLSTLPQFSFEGNRFDAFDDQVEGSVPVFRFFNTVAQGHFFTTDPAERDFVQNNLPQYAFEGIGFYAFPDAIG